MATTHLSKREAPRFKPFQLGNGEWQVFWVFPDGTKDPVEDQTYPSRQNAYRRSKQLNEGNIPPRTIYVRIVAERRRCRSLLRRLKERAPMHGTWVIDPLDEAYPEKRYIDFGLLCRIHKDSRVYAVPGSIPFEAFDDQPPLEEDFLAWLAVIEKEVGAENLHISYHSFPTGF